MIITSVLGSGWLEQEDRQIATRVIARIADARNTTDHAGAVQARRR